MAVLAELSWGQWFMVTTVIGVCAILMLIILVQRGRGEGLSGAFGGGGSSAFGAKTGDVFTWITVVGTVIFLFVAVAANFALDEAPGKNAPASGVSSAPVPGDSAPDVPAGTEEPLPASGEPIGASGSAPGGQEGSPALDTEDAPATEGEVAADPALGEESPSETPPADEPGPDSTEESPGP